jgi:hypothetical protein
MRLADQPLVPIAKILEKTDVVLRVLRLLMLELEAQDSEAVDRAAPRETA